MPSARESEGDGALSSAGLQGAVSRLDAIRDEREWLGAKADLEHVVGRPAVEPRAACQQFP
jgi:hypothetical protein